jgi:hypothetical protein
LSTTKTPETRKNSNGFKQEWFFSKRFRKWWPGGEKTPVA